MHARMPAPRGSALRGTCMSCALPRHGSTPTERAAWRVVRCREVFMDAFIHSIPAAHSLALCFFVGPIGLLCHTVTRTLVLARRRARRREHLARS